MNILFFVVFFGGMLFSQNNNLDFNDNISLFSNKIKNQSDLAKYAKAEIKWEIKRKNEWIEIKPVNIQGTTSYYEIEQEDDLKEIRAISTVNWYDPPCPDCFWKFTVQYSNDTEFAGHVHKTAPPLKYLSGEDMLNPIESGELKAGQKFIITFKRPLYSTRIKWNVNWIILGWRQYFSVDISDIKVKNLKSLNSGEGYSLVGQTDIHPSNHWVISDFKTDLENIGKLWKQRCPKSDVLYYNDASLIWGGLFDINGNWNSPHIGHDAGLHIDISKKHIRKGNREKALEVMCKNAIVYSEGDSSQNKEIPHYHVIYKNTHGEIINKLERDYKYIPCRFDNIPQKCIDLESGGQPVEESLPTESDCL
ncbi:MAG: hypothetical protein AB1637_00520 [Elusimicrobiota bacterium]